MSLLSKCCGQARNSSSSHMQGDPEAKEWVDIAIATHYLDPPQSKTEFLSELTHDLPSWVTTVSWTSTYDSWMF